MKTMELLPPNETMYRALLDRDSSFEGIFFVGVRTTGIFCRPTCMAKKPARENVDFFATSNEALESGYRPCLRCHPMDPEKRPPELIERLRTEVERAPGGRLTDKELAAMSIDPSTARRQFKRHYGMTFQAFHRARRMGLALREVRKGGRVAEAKNGSGFESASGFREAFTRIFGDPPSAAKSRDCMFAERLDTPLDAIRMQLARYFSGENLEFDIPLAPIGSDFQLRTWELLRSIPIAETRSYSWMAERLGIPNARRAVGRASGTNMLSIISSCHRVI